MPVELKLNKVRVQTGEAIAMMMMDPNSRARKGGKQRGEMKWSVWMNRRGN